MKPKRERRPRHGYVMSQMSGFDLDHYQWPRSSGLPLGYFDSGVNPFRIRGWGWYVGTVILAFILGVLIKS